MLDSLASSKTFRASSCRNRTWNRGQRVHEEGWTGFALGREVYTNYQYRLSINRRVKNYMQEAG
jgi:hypothetical protein